MPKGVEIHDTLNPKIWNEDNTLQDDVREKLLQISKAFMESLEIKLDVIDVNLVGSNASYNYNEHSDIDLHLIANFESVDVDKELLNRIYNLERASFNRNYDISIHGIGVEIYVEDMHSSTVSNGIYSILNNEWVKFPQKISDIPDVDISKETYKWVDKISAINDSSTNAEVLALLNSLYLMRKNSLAVDGEFGKGNLIFKKLRNLGYLDKLKDALKKCKSKELSIESLSESLLVEDSRNDLLTKSKTTVRGKQRFNRRNKSRVAHTVRQFNSIDMNKLFKQNILTVNISVNGETDDYTVRISFGGFLDILHDQLKKNNGELNLKCIIRALINGFNKDDVYIGCTCPDFRYRYNYWATKNKISSVDPENRPSNITNPADSLGSGCKHILLVLSNNSWIIKCASVINNYIKYMSKNYERLYADVIYPAIYQKPYDQDVQLDMGDTDVTSDELATDTATLDKANVHDDRDAQGRFTVGNKQGLRFAPSSKDISQVSIFDDKDIPEQ